MIKKINDSDKFICNIVSVTGKTIGQKEFNSFEEACAFRSEKLKEKNIEDVEIYSAEKNIFPYACEDSEDEVKTCCICGEEFTGYGNNPYPIKEDGECCDECNEKYVLKARLYKVKHPNAKDFIVICDKCQMPIIGEDAKCENCDSNVEDTFEEISEAVKKPNRPLQKKKLKISTETAQKLAQTMTSFSDARVYIGEYFDEYYERYRGVTVYKRQLKDDEYEYVAEFLETEYRADTCEEIEKKLDKAIREYVENYANDFETKEIKEINRDLTKDKN